jgi:NAD+ synthase (glutamine-hydrolysing)
MEIDTFAHSWEVIGDILKEPELTDGILVETTLPIYYRSSAYNCKVLILDGKIVAIRPKIFMADGGNYRESRYFSNYKPKNDFMLEEFLLPEYIEAINGQRTVPFGLFNIRTRDDVAIGLEICEEVWRLNTITRNFILDCDVVFCSNGSCFSLNKLNTRIKCVNSRTSSSYSGAYFYTNSIGCDGGRLLFDGSNFVIQNQDVINVGESCPLNEVVVTPIVLDIGAIQSKRLGNINDMRETALLDRNIPEIVINFNFCIPHDEGFVPLTKMKVPFKIDPEPVQLLNVLTSYLWDYLKKASASGFMLALSGGADSGLTAALVYHFCHKLMDYLTNRGPKIREEILGYLRVIVKIPDFDPKNAGEIIEKILYTAYLGTKVSGDETRNRAMLLAEQLGIHH